MRKKIFVIVLALFLTGCKSSNPDDPLESYNRTMFRINQKLDNGIVKPAAKLYAKTTSAEIKTIVGNFFNNLYQIPVFFNQLLQLEIKGCAKTFARFVINSTIGGLGIEDVAKRAGLKAQKQDFGVTLYKLGFKKSTFIILPLLGPCTIRDMSSYFVDYWFLYPTRFIHDFGLRTGLFTTDLINTRYNLLTTEALSNSMNFDEYAFMRDAYLAYRKDLLKKICLEDDDDDDEEDDDDDEEDDEEDED